MKNLKALPFCCALVIPLLFANCAQQVVKGNIYRKGFKEGKIGQQVSRFAHGSYAIFPFKGIYENRMLGIATDGNAIADLLAIQMLYRGYTVLEREKMNKILEEKAFRESDLAAPQAPPAAEPNPAAPVPQQQPQPAQASPPEQTKAPLAPAVENINSFPDNTERYIKIGKLLGVDFIVTGSIIQYEYQLTKGGFMGGGGNVSLAVTITTRIIDVQNGDIIFAMSAGTDGNNLPEALDGITSAFTDALQEGKIYVWE
jgi:Curli production assembly/transport component CsgG